MSLKLCKLKLRPKHLLRTNHNLISSQRIRCQNYLVQFCLQTAFKYTGLFFPITTKLISKQKNIKYNNP